MTAMNHITVLRDAVPLDAIRRALVVKLRHHGDVLLSSPVFSVLKTYAPQAEIDALVYDDTAEMLTWHPAISRVHRIDRQWKKLGVLAQAHAELALYKSLKLIGYDLLIHLTEHWRGAWLCRLLKPRWSVGLAVNGRGRRWKESFSHLQMTPRNALRHTVESNLDALRRIGIQPLPDERRTVLVAGAPAEASVGEHLRRLGLVSGGFIHIHPASRWLFKCWTVDGMVALIERLQNRNWPVVMTAAPDGEEMALINAIQSRLEHPAHSLAGCLSLKELAALTQAARLFIGVDSAPMHIAAAVGTPVVALFGPSGDKQWGPWGVPARVISSRHHPCRPCGIDGCGGGKVSDCLSSLTADEVWAAASELLEN